MIGLADHPIGQALRIASPSGFAIALMTAVSPAPVAAQDPDVQFTVIERTIEPEPRVVPGPAVAIPQPPRGLLYQAPPHAHPEVLPGAPNSLPAPASPETAVAMPGGGPLATGAFRYFQRERVRPANAVPSPGTPEPSTAVLGDHVFQTGNWHASVSRDNGSSWQFISPYTFFPSIAGGFCCDQQAIDVPSHGLVAWMLQYGRTALSGNAYRIAIARNRDDMTSGDPNDWVQYTFRPAANFGYGALIWFDFPDIAFDSQWLYCRANAIGGADSSVIWRMNLDDMRAGGTLRYQYVRSDVIGGWGHRLAKGARTMAFAAYKTVTEMYVWTWPATSTAVTRSTQPITVWNGGAISVRGPDRRDWAGSWPNVGAIIGAYGNDTEAGFLWGCGPRLGRPMPYVRVARFRLSDRSRIAEHDIWSSSTAFLYPDANSNLRGDVGGVIATGSATRYVTVGNFLIDSYDAWPPDTVYLQGTGNSGPNENRFGDFFTVRRHPQHPQTFVSNGSYQLGGPDAVNAEHQFVWFGRDDDEPTWVRVNVQTTGVASASIQSDVTDLDGRRDESSPYVHRFAPSQAYELTAPLTVSSGSIWAFDRWTLTASPGGSPSARPQGERVLRVPSIGTLDDHAVASYVPSRALTIRSTAPATGVNVSVSPDDYHGNADGSTPFVRSFRDGEVVRLSAIATVGFNRFKRWTEGSTVHPPGRRTLTVTMSTNRTVTAEYWDNVAGSVSRLGAGCTGSNGRVPRHRVTWPSGQQGPQQGSPTSYTLSAARALTPSVLFLGLSTGTFNGLPLPLDLALIGADGCQLYHDVVADVPIPTDAGGAASTAIAWPIDPATIGTHIFSSFFVVDPGAPRSAPLTTSDAFDLVLGGDR